MAFEPIGENYASRMFNDRRIGGKKLGIQSKPEPKHQYPNTGKDKGTGGLRVPRKPKPPKSPMPARAVAVKHKVSGY